MIYEFRAYDLHPRNLSRYLDLFSGVGLPIISEVAPLIGFWRGDTGTMPRVYHVWAYSDYFERHKRRTQLSKDPRWANHYLPEALPLIERQTSQLLEPLPVSIDTLALARSGSATGCEIASVLRHIIQPNDMQLMIETMRKQRAFLHQGGHMVGCWRSLTGNCDELVSIWRHLEQPAADSNQSGLGMDQHPAREFHALIAPHVQSTSCDLLVPTGFSPIK